MYCENCGQKNNDGSLFCEYCGASMMDPVAPDNPSDGGVNSIPVTSVNNMPTIIPNQKKNKKPKGEKSFAIPIIITLVILAVAGGLLAFFLLRGKGDGGKQSYYKAFGEEDVVFPENGEAYVANQLLVKAEDGVTEDTIEKTLKDYKGEIVGINYVTDIYQVEFSKKEEDELLKLRDDIAGEKDVKSVTLHYVYYNQCLIGSNGDLDGTLMGLADADYDKSLVGDIGVVLVGSAEDNSGLGKLLPDVKVTDIAKEDNSLVSLYEIENDMTNSLGDDHEIFEMAANLVPTVDEGDAGYEAVVRDMNTETTDFVKLMSEADEDFIILSSTRKDDTFINGINDEEAEKRILRIGDADEADDIADIYADSDSGDPVEYATTIALITWINNKDLTPENIRDILSYSYPESIGDGRPGIMDATISTEVARRLRDYEATSSDGGKKLSLKDILVVINEVRVERGLPVIDVSDESSGDSSLGDNENWRQLYLEYVKANDIFNLTVFPADPIGGLGKNYIDDYTVIKNSGEKIFYYDYDNDGCPELYYEWIETCNAHMFHITKYYIENGSVTSEDYGYYIDGGGYSINDNQEILDVKEALTEQMRDRFAESDEYAYHDGDPEILIRYSGDIENIGSDIPDGGEPNNLEDIYRFIESGAVYGEDDSNAEDDLSDDSTGETVDKAVWKEAYIDFLMQCESDQNHNEGVEFSYYNLNVKSYYTRDGEVQDFGAVRFAKYKDDIFNMSGSGIELIYLNDDDIPELLLKDGWNIYVVTYYDGEVECAGIVGGKLGFDYAERENVIYGTASGTGSYIYTYSSLEDGKLVGKYTLYSNSTPVNGQRYFSFEGAYEDYTLDYIESNFEVDETQFYEMYDKMKADYSFRYILSDENASVSSNQIDYNDMNLEEVANFINNL